jgi:hypothetical protein
MMAEPDEGKNNRLPLRIDNALAISKLKSIIWSDKDPATEAVAVATAK